MKPEADHAGRRKYREMSFLFLMVDKHRRLLGANRVERHHWVV